MTKTSLLQLIVLLILLFAAVPSAIGQSVKNDPQQFLVVLGIAQDAGYPQIGCERTDCIQAQTDRSLRKLVVSLGLVDKASGQKWLFEATPDIGEQLFALNKFLPGNSTLPDGIFLTHAHIGHYSGLMYLGREAIGANKVPVFAMPRMETFLNENAPWSQLINLGNIAIKNLEHNKTVEISRSLKVKPFLVPHRDEFSETVGFEISGKNKTALFIPDIDKWSKWENDLEQLVKKVDYLLIDATFFKNGEIPNRDMSEIPHPFVEETAEQLKNLSKNERGKVIFIHFNHTNPLINKNSKERVEIQTKGFKVADEGLVLPL